MADTLNLFPNRVAIGRADAAGNVYMSVEFTRAMATLLARMGGPSGPGMDDLANELATSASAIGLHLARAVEDLALAHSTPAVGLHLVRAVEDLDLQLAQVLHLAAHVGQLRDALACLEAGAVNVSPPTDWEHPGKIGASSPNSGKFTTLQASGQIRSTVAAGTAPLLVASTTRVDNLNAATVDGKTFPNPGPIGGTTADAGTFTALQATGILQAGASGYTEHTFAKTVANDGGNAVLIVRNGTGTLAIGVAGVTGTGYNQGSAALYVNKSATSGRSVNAAGTLNASGADYAEYVRKAPGCGTVAKGDVVGFDARGEITDQWAAAVSFGVKTTEPNLVGGDTWGRPEVIGERPVPDPQEPDEPDEEFAARCVAFDESDPALAAWRARFEEERAKYDRIAFAGVVPVNIAGAAPGDYVLPAPNGEGIQGVAVAPAALTLAQYVAAVGIVHNIAPDGRPCIRVKVA